MAREYSDEEVENFYEHLVEKFDPRPWNDHAFEIKEWLIGRFGEPKRSVVLKILQEHRCKYSPEIKDVEAVYQEALSAVGGVQFANDLKSTEISKWLKYRYPAHGETIKQIVEHHKALYTPKKRSSKSSNAAKKGDAKRYTNHLGFTPWW
jgi:hypothetical protein